MPNNPDRAAARKAARIWVKDVRRVEGGYWYAAAVPKHKHGTFSTYNNWYCRCNPCTDANAIHTQQQKERKIRLESA